MVESEKIKNNYILLLELVKNEAKENPMVMEYFNYLNEYAQKFTDSSNVYIKEELKEFLRGANRYSDEFSFTDKYYSEIRIKTNDIYEILNNERFF
jgi:hypothetical protein